MLTRRWVARVAALLVWASCHPSTPPNSPPALTTVPSIDLQRYAGTWHEVARLPNRFQRKCQCSQAHYSLHPDGYVRVRNTCQGANYSSSIQGKAFVVPGSNNTRLRVQFFWPFRGDYWVIDCAPDYSYAVVSEPQRRYLWILARKKQLPPDTLQSIENRLRTQHFDLSKLIRNKNICE